MREWGRRSCSKCGKRYDPAARGGRYCVDCVLASWGERIEGPALEIACANCAHAEPSEHAESAYLCRLESIRACRPWSGAPKLWVLRGDRR